MSREIRMADHLVQELITELPAVNGLTPVYSIDDGEGHVSLQWDDVEEVAKRYVAVLLRPILKELAIPERGTRRAAARIRGWLYEVDNARA